MPGPDHFSSWHDLYQHDLQGVYALVVAPGLFLVYRLARGRPRGALLTSAAPFVDVYAIAFAVETIIDPIATGPLVRALGIADGAGGTAMQLLFVLLGDFRVYLLVFGLIAIAAGRHWSAAIATAAGWTVVVPVGAYAANAALRAAVAGLDPDSIWLVYELLFTGLALALRARLVPVRVPGTQPALRAYLRAALLYAALYYAGWALADALIQIGRIDAGWLLRILPNQLYYALWVPAVFFAFFSRR